MKRLLIALPFILLSHTYAFPKFYCPSYATCNSQGQCSFSDPQILPLRPNIKHPDPGVYQLAATTLNLTNTMATCIYSKNSQVYISFYATGFLYPDTNQTDSQWINQGSQYECLSSIPMKCTIIIYPNKKV